MSHRQFLDLNIKQIADELLTVAAVNFQPKEAVEFDPIYAEPAPRVITRVMSDGVQTKDGAA